VDLAWPDADLRRIGMGWHSAPRARLLLTGLRDGTVIASGCLLVIVVVWTIHVAATPHLPPPGSPAGAKDEAFMSHTYRAYLEGARGISPWWCCRGAGLHALHVG